MKLWLVLLAIWLIVYGAIGVLHLSFEGMALIMGVVAIVDGVLILMNK
jgi:hypothetical protein